MNHPSAPDPLWSRTVWLKHTHTRTYTHAPIVAMIFRYSRVQSFCSGALEDCDWWCGRLQGSGCLPGDRAMWQSVCVCVCVCEGETEQGHVRECMYLSALKPATNVKCEFWPSGQDEWCFQLACQSIIREASAAGCLSQSNIRSLALQCSGIAFFPPISWIKLCFSDW